MAARRRRRRELFPPRRGLQARMAATAILTPLIVLALVVAVVDVAPTKLLGGMAVATIAGLVAAVKARQRVESTRPLRPDEHPELHATVERLCVLADLPRAEIVVDDEKQPNSWIIDPPGRPPAPEPDAGPARGVAAARARGGRRARARARRQPRRDRDDRRRWTGRG